VILSSERPAGARFNSLFPLKVCSIFLQQKFEQTQVLSHNERCSLCISSFDLGNALAAAKNRTSFNHNIAWRVIYEAV
jgi:predicted restriction endonuclease